PASRSATDSWACAPPARSAGARPGWPGWAIADGHLGRVATSPACSTCPTPSRQCRRWCLSPIGRACAFCWTESRCWRARAKCFSAPANSTCAAACCCRRGRIAPPAGITATGRELRLLSLADRAAGLQFLQLALDPGGIDVRLEASFAMAGLGMEPVRLEQDLGAWRTEGTRKGVAMTGAAKLRLGGDPLVPDRPFSLRWAWRWRSVAGQVAEFDRLVAV